MKITLILLFVLSPIVSLCQDSTIALSKFEQFTSETGTMYKRETLEMGSVKNIHVYATRVSEVGNSTYAKAIRVIQSITQSDVNNVTASLTIDLDETEGIYKALEYYLTVIKNKVQYSPAYFYITKNDVVASCNFIVEKYTADWSVSLSQRYHSLKSVVPGSSITVKNKDIDNLVELIRKAKERNF